MTALPDLIDLDRRENLIAGVVVHALTVHRDRRGLLVEMLRADWPEIVAPERPFAQSYYSITYPWIARDEDRWHVHQHQEDRFIVCQGDVVLAIYDWRPESPTYGRLNLFLLGESSRTDWQPLVLVPARTLHGFVVVGDRPAVLVNFPTRLYNPADEGRVPFSDVKATFSDGEPFDWERIRAWWRRRTA